MNYRVYVVKFRDCKNLVMRYKDPVTGKYERSTTYTDPQTGEVFTTGDNRKEAKKLAARWEGDLNAGRAQSRYATTWAAFRERYENEVVPGLAERTANKIATTLNTVERILPRVANGKLADLTAEAISRLQAALRDGKRSEDTIKSYLNHLRAALSWAVGAGDALQDACHQKGAAGEERRGRPQEQRPCDHHRGVRADVGGDPRGPAGGAKLKRYAARKTARNKGLKEHKTTTDDIPVEIPPDTVASWRYYLRGLWLSGLRLEESLILYWDRPDRLHVDLTGRRPMMIIPRELEKGGQDRRLPILPDFFAFLLETPQVLRHGPIFNPLMLSGQRANYERAGRVISLIGEQARVVVHTHPKTGKVKFCSAHDLRRSFGDRWARKVPTAVLQKLMRHSSIATTMTYYVDLEAEELAEQLYRDLGQEGSVFGSVSVFPPGPADGPTTQTTIE